MTRIQAALRVLPLVLLVSQIGGAQSLRGSRSSVNRMYARAVSSHLDFLRTPASIYNAVKDSELVAIGFTDDVDLDRVKYPFVLPHTREVIYAFAARYHAACGQRTVLTSAVRPVAEQPRNASLKSVHPTGMAVDFRRPTGTCLKFMRKDLLALEKQGVLEATEERHPVHFHVAVFERPPARRPTDEARK